MNERAPANVGKEGPPVRRYDKGERRLKHVGQTAAASVDAGNPKKVVGKCPNNIPDPVKERVLETAVAEHAAEREQPFPSRMFAVHNGVVYDCRTTTRGVSYHAFPYHGDMLRELHDRLAASADAQTNARTFRQWVAKHVRVLG